MNRVERKATQWSLKSLNLRQIFLIRKRFNAYYLFIRSWFIFFASHTNAFLKLKNICFVIAGLFPGGNMLTSLFFKGSLIGFSIAMPVGPVGMLCIQHSLRQGLLAGLIAGCGAALADAVFGGMAGFGISLLSHIFMRYQLGFQIIGSLVLWYLGIKIFKSHPTKVETCEVNFSRSRIFFSTFVLTLTNPLTFLSFAAIYASLGITPSEEEILPGIILTLGVLLGAAIWWTILTFGVTKIGKKFQLSSSPLLNRISGGILTGCGCLTSLSAIKQLLFLI